MSLKNPAVIEVRAVPPRPNPAVSSIHSSGSAYPGLLIDPYLACGTAARKPS